MTQSLKSKAAGSDPAPAPRLSRAAETGKGQSAAPSVEGRAGAVGNPMRRLGGWRAPLTTEHGLLAAGITAAAASGFFGLYMNLRDHQEPDIRATQYLTVFAQMAQENTLPSRTLENGTSENGEAARNGDAKIDPMTTGSIPPSPRPPADRAGEKLGPLKGYVVRDVFENMALIESPYGLTLVKPGTMLLGAGVVRAIELRKGKWVAITSQGVIGSAEE